MTHTMSLKLCFLLVCVLLVLRVSSLSLPAQTTTTAKTPELKKVAAAAAPATQQQQQQQQGQQPPAATKSNGNANSESNDSEPFYTTKRNANVYVEFPSTQSPLLVLNAEKETVASATIAPKQRAGAAGTKQQQQQQVIATTPKPQRSSSEVPLYRLNSPNGQACVLLQVDALITIKYKDKLGEEQEADVYVPDNAVVTGNCDGENSIYMSIKWDAYVLSWYFSKTPGGERWYVDKIELTYNSSDRHFEHPQQPNKTVRLSTSQKHSMLFPTPVGKSYSCNEEQEVSMTDNKNHASVLLRELKLQPFKFKSNDFAAEFSCTSLSARANRDETAPVAVGSTLAAVVLLTITGYAGWRHFKVKKVNYDNME
ncbi:hypothetical protein TKK_0018851 [Trichogramma kaykai]|uniref:Lysosome-associated membrane glycoprotein 2-like luminal domain-containing protein n=1 Tax=Trichogramma kaykai TaxID=54128 RepID=A0ABD2VVU6_9HYME